MDIYLNTNVFCRPFDDLRQERILKEALAATRIFLWAESKLISVVASEINLSELMLIDNMYKRETVEQVVAVISSKMITVQADTINLADNLSKMRIINDYMDILHLAAASSQKAEYFLTCDDEILKKRQSFEPLIKLKILNPVEFVKQMEVKF